MPPRLLFLLHGYEDEPDRLAAIDWGLPATAPRGPIETGRGPAWWEGHDPHDGEPPLPDVLDHLDARIDSACEGAGVRRSEVAVVGFSQGGALALALACRGAQAEPLGWCGVLCGYLLAPDVVDYDFARAAGHTRFLLAHGANDDAVDPTQCRSAARILEQRGLDVRWDEVIGVGHDPAPLAPLVTSWWSAAT